MEDRLNDIFDQLGETLVRIQDLIEEMESDLVAKVRPWRDTEKV